MTTSRTRRRDEITSQDLEVLKEIQALDPAYAALFTSLCLKARSDFEDYKRICAQLANFGPPAYRDRFQSFLAEPEAPKFLTLLADALTRIKQPYNLDVYSYDDKTLFRNPAERWDLND